MNINLKHLTYQLIPNKRTITDACTQADSPSPLYTLIIATATNCRTVHQWVFELHAVWPTAGQLGRPVRQATALHHLLLPLFHELLDEVFQQLLCADAWPGSRWPVHLAAHVHI